MKNFFITNALGVFSLIILAFLIIQGRNYHYTEGEKNKKLWLVSLVCAFFVQTLDIATWALSGVAGEEIRIISYFTNCLYFVFSVAFCFVMSAFLEYNINYSEKAYNFLKKVFIPLLILNCIITLLSIPFGLYFFLDQNNNYIRGPLNFVSACLGFFSLFFVYLRIILIYKEESKNLKSVLTIGLLIPLAFNILQVTNISPVPVLFPSVTLSVLFFYLFLISNSLNIDYLTGLQNKRGINRFFDNLPNIISSYLAVIFIDLNDFKTINDVYGHKEGDLAIVTFSKIITKVTRKNDLAARIGADEFLITVIVNNEEELKLIIRRIETELDLCNKILNKPYNLSMSCGSIIVNPNIPFDKDKIISDADRIMYKQKNKNKKDSNLNSET